MMRRKYYLRIKRKNRHAVSEDEPFLSKISHTELVENGKENLNDRKLCMHSQMNVDNRLILLKQVVKITCENGIVTAGQTEEQL